MGEEIKKGGKYLQSFSLSSVFLATAVPSSSSGRRSWKKNCVADSLIFFHARVFFSHTVVFQLLLRAAHLSSRPPQRLALCLPRAAVLPGARPSHRRRSSLRVLCFPRAASCSPGRASRSSPSRRVLLPRALLPAARSLSLKLISLLGCAPYRVPHVATLFPIPDGLLLHCVAALLGAPWCPALLLYSPACSCSSLGARPCFHGCRAAPYSPCSSIAVVAELVSTRGTPSSSSLSRPAPSMVAPTAPSPSRRSARPVPSPAGAPFNSSSTFHGQAQSIPPEPLHAASRYSSSPWSPCACSCIPCVSKPWSFFLCSPLVLATCSSSGSAATSPSFLSSSRAWDACRRSAPPRVMRLLCASCLSAELPRGGLPLPVPSPAPSFCSPPRSSCAHEFFWWTRAGHAPSHPSRRSSSSSLLALLPVAVSSSPDSAQLVLVHVARVSLTPVLSFQLTTSAAQRKRLDAPSPQPIGEL
jgi:hypothetical protein